MSKGAFGFCHTGNPTGMSIRELDAWIGGALDDDPPREQHRRERDEGKRSRKAAKPVAGAPGEMETGVPLHVLTLARSPPCSPLTHPLPADCRERHCEQAPAPAHMVGRSDCTG